MRKVIAVVCAVAVLAGCKPTGSTGGGAGSSADGLTIAEALEKIPAGEEDRSGYDRDKFEHWVDADGDGCDTREQVLIDEKTAGSVKDCKVTGGKWLSYYDGKEWTKSTDVDIDHLVPLAEAWDSGAKSWDADRRRRYANDLGDDRTLVAVTDNVNQEKSDQDPAEWLPPLKSVQCRYAAEWVAVKLRWGLSADDAERRKLKELAGGCPDERVTVKAAD
ncbi:HNH endonuclease family protein [Actinorhabdospora filicis]|nr:HNH endonuclease family protein [Actinorhabdospora filicis]